MSRLHPFGKSRYEKSSTRFLVPIFQTNVRDKTLGLPSNFVSEYGDELSDVVNMTDPDGHVWQVDLTKGKNNFWFDGDWDKIVKYHSISDGYVLVFKYNGLFKGTSNFNVYVFDKTNSEIQYACNEPRNDVEDLRNDGKKGSQHHQDMEDGDMIDHFRSASRPTTNKRPSTLQTNTSQKNMARPSTDSAHQQSKKRQRDRSSDPKENSRSEPECHKRRRKVAVKRETGSTDDEDYVNDCNESDDVDLQGIITPRSFFGLYRKGSPETKRGVQKACVSKPEKCSFMIILQAYNIRGSYMYVPASFTNKYLPDTGKSIKLQVPDGKQYSVGICRRKNAGRMSLTWGWAEFIRDSGLRNGDVCLFELVPSAAGIVFQFSMHPVGTK